MILLWGLPGDTPLSFVRRALDELHAPSVFVDQHRVLELEVEFSVGAQVQGDLHLGGQRIDLGAVRSIYLRGVDSRRLPIIERVGLESEAAQAALAAVYEFWSWCDVTPALVVNRPRAMAANNSKPYQAMVIRDQGFRTPETLLTNEPTAVEEFWEEHGAIIYKSTSGIRSIVKKLEPEDRARFSDLQWCPTQFQAYVPGVDYRVHVVAHQLFACEIISDAVDYRYARRDGLSVAMRACTLPLKVQSRCLALAAAMNLVVAGIDLRRTPEGEWFCFEVNPSPAFSYFQQMTGQPVDAGIARLLAGGAASTL